MATILATSRTPDVIRELGARVRRLRLQRNQTVEDLAEDAGVGVNTIRRVEAGHSVGMSYFVRILRALGRLAALDAFIHEPEVSPIEIARFKGRERQRASGSLLKKVGAAAREGLASRSVGETTSRSRATARRKDDR